MSREQINQYAYAMNDLSLDLKKLMLLKVLLETESLAKTSVFLGMAVSTASRELAMLREIFKDPLFVRSGNRMVPTLKMRNLGDKLDRVFSSIGDLLDLKRQNNPEETLCGTIRVAANDNCFSVFVGTVLPMMKKVSRGFKVEIYPASMGSLEGMRRGLIDFLIAQDPFLQTDRHFHCKPLLSSPHVVAMRRNHPVLDAVRANPKAVMEIIEPYAMVQTPISMPSGFNGLPPIQRIMTNALVQTPYFISTLFLASNSDAVIICPRVLVRTAAEQLGLQCVLIPQAEPWQPKLYWHERTHEDPMHQRFRGLLELGARNLEKLDQAESSRSL